MVEGYIQRRDFRRVDRRQWIRRVLVSLHRRVRRRQFHVLQIHRNRYALGIRQAGAALDLLAIQRQVPRAWLAIDLHRSLIQRGAERGQFADLDVSTAQQLLGAAARIPASVLAGQILPRRDVQFRQHPANAQALGARQHRFASTEKQFATAIGEIARRRGKSEIGQLIVIEPVPPLLPLQGHAKHCVAPDIGGHAERRRQIHRHAFEAGADQQLTVGPGKIQLQLIRNRPGHRQRLGHTQPVSELLHFDLPRRRNSGLDLVGAAISEDLRSDRFVEGPCRDVLAAKAFIAVEAEIALELAQFELRFGQFQPRVGGFEIDEDFRLLALGQRNIQLELAIQITRALPTGKGLTSADRRIVKNLQAVAETTGKCAIKEQMRVLPGRYMRNIDEDIADLGVEQLAFAGPDAHAAVFDEHIAADFAHMRPARLKRQFGVMHFEEQADAAIGLASVLAQRALILEEALVHCAFEDRCAQPLIKRRAQYRRQVFRGVATVAVDQADAQVHVVFLAMVEVQANEEIAGNLALLAQYLEVWRNQGEAILVEFPGQPRIGLQVLPWLGENRIEVQDEILAVEAQLAAVEVAAEAATDIARRRSAVVGIETDIIEVGGKAEFVAIGGGRAEVQQHVTQAAG